MSDVEEKEVYVLLDFQSKDMTKLLKQPKFFFRMLNLNENKPIVEVCDDIFEGVYEDVPGTNLFFEEVEDNAPKTNLFEFETPITLKYLLKQSKILKLNHIGKKHKLVLNPSPIESVNIDITDDYRALLDKYKSGKLNIDDYIVKNPCLLDDDDDDDENEDEVQNATSNTDEEEEKTAPITKLASLPERITSIPEWYSSVTENTKLRDNPTYAKYLKLQKLAEQPTKHKVETEDVPNKEFEQPLHTVPKNNFIIWKDMMMRVVERQPINLDVSKHNINDFVDIKKSIELGIIGPSDVTPRVYSKREKQKLLSFKNFISLTPLMKLIILQDCLQYEKSEIENMNVEETEAKGEDNLSPNDRVTLLSLFKEELKLHIMNRIKDAQKQKDLFSTIDFDINLSDDSYEESSSDDYSNTDSDSKSDMSADEENIQ